MFRDKATIEIAAGGVLLALAGLALFWVRPEFPIFWQESVFVACGLAAFTGVLLVAAGCCRLARKRTAIQQGIRRWDRFWTGPKLLLAAGLSPMVAFCTPLVLEEVRAREDFRAPPSPRALVKGDDGVKAGLPPRPRALVTIGDGTKVDLTLSDNDVELNGPTSLSSTPAENPLTARGNRIKKTGPGTVFEVRPPVK